MKKLLSILAVVLLGTASLFAQTNINLTSTSAFGPWIGYTQGQQMPCVVFGTVDNPPPVTIHTFGYWPATGTVAVLTVTIRGNQGGADFDVTTGSTTTGGTLTITGTYKSLCMKVTTLSGAGASISGSYLGNVAGATLGSVTITGDVTSATASSFKSMVSGTAADGAAVVGNPVRIGGKDGSGNTQDICTDTAGNVCTGIPDGGDINGGGTADAAATAGGTGSESAKLRLLTSQMNSLLALANTDPCSGTLKVVKVINIATNTTTVLSAASASNKLYGCAFHIVVGAADNIALVEDATGSCASPDAGMAGGTTAATGWNLIANDKIGLGSGAGTIFQTASTNVNVCLITSTSAQVSGTLEYVLAP